MPFNGEMPNQLVQSVAEGKSLAFVGAGFSMAVERSTGERLPDWPGLLRQILDLARLENVPFSGLEAEIEGAISSGKLIMAAQELEERIADPTKSRILRQIFLDDNVRPNHLHEKLVSIPFKGILTTNYDMLVEGAYTLKTGGRIPPVLTQEDLEKVQNPLRAKGPFVFKLHGDINRPDTIVLSSHDYQDLLFRRPGYRSFLETAFTVNTVLFLGFGLEDPDIDNMLDRLASIFSRTNESHYALMPKGRFSSLEKRRMLLDKRIRIIEYENSNGSHQQVYEFLSYLFDLTAPAGEYRDEYNKKVLSLSKEKPQPKPKELSLMIIHAGEDKPFVRKLAYDLQSHGISVWFDEWTIKVGDSLVARIDEGIKSTDYALVVFSQAFFNKQWPQRELDSALFREAESNRVFVLPIVLDVDHNAIMKFSPQLAGKMYLDFSHSYEDSFKRLVNSLKKLGQKK
jgi:hypothetical protein